MGNGFVTRRPHPPSHVGGWMHCNGQRGSHPPSLARRAGDMAAERSRVGLAGNRSPVGARPSRDARRSDVHNFLCEAASSV